MSIFVILSAEKVCRLFRYRSGLAARRLPLHNQHTYSANHKYTAISRLSRPFFPPCYYLLQGRYFKGIVTPLILPCTHQNIFLNILTYRQNVILYVT